MLLRWRVTRRLLQRRPDSRKLFERQLSVRPFYVMPLHSGLVGATWTSARASQRLDLLRWHRHPTRRLLYLKTNWVGLQLLPPSFKD